MKLIFENFKKCEEYISLMHLCYELIFPYSNDGKSYVYILQITDKNYMYQLFNIYSYLLRYSYNYYRHNNINYSVGSFYVGYKYKKLWTNFETSIADGYNGSNGLSSNKAYGWTYTAGWKFNPHL